jgi:hypothetical protein
VGVPLSTRYPRAPDMCLQSASSPFPNGTTESAPTTVGRCDRKRSCLPSISRKAPSPPPGLPASGRTPLPSSSPHPLPTAIERVPAAKQISSMTCHEQRTPPQACQREPVGPEFRDCAYNGFEKNHLSGHLFIHQFLDAIQCQRADTRRRRSRKNYATIRNEVIQARAVRPGREPAVPNRACTMRSTLLRRDNEIRQPSGNQFSTPDPGDSLRPPPAARA